MLTEDWSKNHLEEVETCPKEQLKIKFGDVEVTTIGQVITPTQAQNAPSLSWSYNSDKLYAIFMMDPDAPSRKTPKKREWYHWCVLNVPENDIQNGDVAAEYIGAGPPSSTGLHRYVILVYEQSTKLKSVHQHLGISADGRGNQKVKKFAASYKIGSPVAGGCFQAEYDDYVPKLYAKMK